VLIVVKVSNSNHDGTDYLTLEVNLVKTVRYLISCFNFY
jgi:hypothetical protein